MNKNNNAFSFQFFTSLNGHILDVLNDKLKLKKKDKHDCMREWNEAHKISVVMARFVYNLQFSHTQDARRIFLHCNNLENSLPGSYVQLLRWKYCDLVDRLIVDSLRAQGMCE